MPDNWWCRIGRSHDCLHWSGGAVSSSCGLSRWSCLERFSHSTDTANWEDMQVYVSHFPFKKSVKRDLTSKRLTCPVSFPMCQGALCSKQCCQASPRWKSALWPCGWAEGTCIGEWRMTGVHYIHKKSSMKIKKRVSRKTPNITAIGSSHCQQPPTSNNISVCK